ncbi:thiamine-phosphate kinase [Actinomycetaceae bacterium MB13-C1-2]|nr:thiamine-phosphate kinase [Actinomycetaceae bacterium MB13-C1-2]
MAQRLLVSDLSEGQILSRILPILPQGKYAILGSGDDCAVVQSPGGRFAVTTDVLVENVHFRRDWSNPDEIGMRAAVQNLSDVNAMGAHTTALVVSLVLPPDLEIDWLERFAGGLAAVVAPTGAGIVGGDLSRGEGLVISVTAHGKLSNSPITRSGARPGDTLAVVGNLGYSAAGLAALSSGAVSGSLHGADVPVPYRRAVALYRCPEAPLEAGPLAASRGATAMLDISDGLVEDGIRMAEASDVTLDLTRNALASRVEELSEVGNELGVDPLEWVLYGGEDHGLLVAFPPYVLVTAPFTAIGTIGERKFARSELVTLDRVPLEQRGFDHFRS